jgi:prolyl 4-hydroxylase
MQKVLIENEVGTEIYKIPNLLTEEECNYLCDLVDKSHQRSTVVGYDGGGNTVSAARTSSTCSFPIDDKTVSSINTKLHDVLDIPLSHGEPMQGQLYEVGQEFKDHHDYFSNKGFTDNCLHSGQRTWTCMVYLNDVEEGGETEFPRLGLKFTPEKGSAVIWKDSNGSGFEDINTLHGGRPVKQGKKYIITKWFRENPFDSNQDRLLAAEYKTFTAKPGGTPINSYLMKQAVSKGVIKPELLQELQTYFKESPSSLEFTPEDTKGLDKYLFNVEQETVTTLTDLSDELKNKLGAYFLPAVKHLTGQVVEHTFTYGIRTYQKGSVMKLHTDRTDVCPITVLLNIDQKVNSPWPFTLIDASGVSREHLLEPGQYLIYEGSQLRHGRKFPLDGNFYSNVLIHYKLA